MPIINIRVRRKKAAGPVARIVCGNSDYKISFNFDEEWDAHPVKTARFIWNGQYQDVVFNGNVCDVPVLTNTAVGVYAGDLRTTTPALIACDKSILCGNGLPADPSPDVYAQIMRLLNNIGPAGAGGIIDVTQLPIASDTAMELPNLTAWAETENAGEYSCAAHDNGEPIPVGNYKITDPDGKLHLFTIQNWGFNGDFGQHRVELFWNSVDGMFGTEILEYYEYDYRTGTTKRRTMRNGLQFSEELNKSAFYRLNGALFYYDAETEKRIVTDSDLTPETWTFTLEDGSTVTKAVYVG